MTFLYCCSVSLMFVSFKVVKHYFFDLSTSFIFDIDSSFDGSCLPAEISECGVCLYSSAEGAQDNWSLTSSS